jgi:polyketide synthase PksJ
MRVAAKGAAVCCDDEWNPLERNIAKVWREILKVGTVGLHDNFFEIGGDSLALIRVYNRLRPTSDRALSITDLFDHPTISSLAGLLGASAADAGT